MNAFQVIGLSVAAVFALLNLRAFVRQPDARSTSLAWLALTGLGAYAIVDPESTTRFAGLLGIQRGADLLLYMGVLCGIAAFFYVCVRLRRIERGITAIVRRIAIEHAVLPDAPAAHPTPYVDEFDVEEPLP